MVAEAVQETEQPVAEVAEVTAPDPALESAPAEEDISEEALTGFLKEKGFVEDVATDAGKDEAPASQDSGPSLEGLTPQQILELGKQQGKSETQAEAESRNAAYVAAREREGLARTVNDGYDESLKELTDLGLDAVTATRIARRIHSVNGAWRRIYDMDMAAVGNSVQGAQSAALETWRNENLEAVKKFLGSKADSFLGQWKNQPEGERSLEKMFQKVVDAAGYLSPSDVAKSNRDAVVAAFKKLPKEARDVLGWNSVTVPANENAAGVSSRRGTVEWALEAPVDQLLADKARRAAAG